MNKETFHRTLEKAVAGDQDAIEAILELYMPLINSSSILNGILDEDLNQHILVHIVLNISKFPL